MHGATIKIVYRIHRYSGRPEFRYEEDILVNICD
jgi:hypothetical protein